MEHHFQVNLRGIIDLLSNHLYSGPDVFVRELLQNAVDAIHARERIDPDVRGEILMELTRASGGKPAALVVSENGIGLTEAEIHRFLATIGESSKRGIDRADFIGQFGIGLLSCFMVSDEIVVVTRSATPGAAAMEWRGKADGTYTVKQLEVDISPGTQVYLTCKVGAEEFYERERLIELARHFGLLLPYPIRVASGKGTTQVNAEPPPWRGRGLSAPALKKALVKFGREAFGETFFDAIPLGLKEGGLDGVAFVLNAAPAAGAKQRHRVYLKNMFLTESAEDLLPPWAFFVRLFVNVSTLKPTASREGLQDDRALEAARDALGDRLRAYLIELSEKEPDKLTRLISIHNLTIKALAVADDEFYRIVFDWLPVETSTGEMTLGEYRGRHDVIRYAPTVDAFRQISHVAAAQGLCVINAGYTYDTDLLTRYPYVFEGGRIERVEAGDVTQSFTDLDEAEEKEAAAFIREAAAVLRPLRCHADIKKFAPADVPTLYTTSADGQFLRSVEQSKEIANPLWSSVLDNVAPRMSGGGPFAHLCFNFENRLLRRLLAVRHLAVIRRAVQMLYVQALLLGHHPLSSREMQLLNEGLLGLIELSLDAAPPADKRAGEP